MSSFTRKKDCRTWLKWSSDLFLSWNEHSVFFVEPFALKSLKIAWKSYCAPFAGYNRAISIAVAIWKLPLLSIIKSRWFANGNCFSVICLLPWPTCSNFPFNRLLFHACGIMLRHNRLLMFFLFLFDIRIWILIWTRRIFYIILSGRICTIIRHSALFVTSTSFTLQILGQSDNIQDKQEYSPQCLGLKSYEITD